MVGRKAEIFVDALAPISARSQKQIRNVFPALEILQPRIGKPFHLAQHGDFRGNVRVKAGPQQLQLAENQPFERLLQRGAHRIEVRICAGMPQPLIALFEHLHDEPFRGLEIVVQMQQQVGQCFVILVHMAQRVAGGLAIQVLGLFRNFRHGAESREPGHAPRDGRAQRVDGFDPQLRRILQEDST